MKLENDKQYWFVAYVKTNMERKAAEMLGRQGIGFYLPMKRVVRKWSDRRKVVEMLLLPHMIFVHCTPKVRLESIKTIPYLNCYMSEGGPFNPVVIPDGQMEDFRRAVECTGVGVTMTNQNLAPGDRVIVIDGPLKGVKCELVSMSGKVHAVIRLSILGAAVVDIPASSLNKLE